MEVQVIDEKGNPKELLRGCGTKAKFQEYTNKITNRPDPMIVYAPARFVHMSTIVNRYKYQVQNTKTGEIVSVENLDESQGVVVPKDEL